MRPEEHLPRHLPQRRARVARDHLLARQESLRGNLQHRAQRHLRARPQPGAALLGRHRCNGRKFVQQLVRRRCSCSCFCSSLLLRITRAPSVVIHCPGARTAGIAAGSVRHSAAAAAGPQPASSRPPALPAQLRHCRRHERVSCRCCRNRRPREWWPPGGDSIWVWGWGWGWVWLRSRGWGGSRR